MACGCSRNRIYTQGHPLVLGDPNGQPAANYRGTVSLMGMRANSSFWATGSDVDAMVSAGWLVPL